MPPTVQDIQFAIKAATDAGDPESAEYWRGQLPAEPSMGQVLLNAVPKGVANLINSPVAMGNLVGEGIQALRERGTFGEGAKPSSPFVQTPNYPMEFAQRVGLVREEAEPQTNVQRIADALVQGGVGMAATPTKVPGVINWLRQVGTGGAAGGIGEAVHEATDNTPASVIANILSFFAMRGKDRPAPTPREQIRNEAAEAGYAIPPSEATPTLPSKALEFVGGKQAVADKAALRNQVVTNDLAAQSIGLPKGTALTPSVLEAVRAEAGKVYEEVGKLRPPEGMPWFKRYHETDLVEQYKKAKADARLMFDSNRRDPHPEKLASAKASEATAESIERDLEVLAFANGRTDLMKAFRDARTRIARSYDIERAINEGDLNVSAHRLGSVLDRGEALGGELEKIARVGRAFPKATREAAGIAEPGLRASDMIASAILGGTGYGLGGLWTGLSAIPLARAPVRSFVLSKPYQRSFVKGPYAGPSQKERIIQALVSGGAMASEQE